MASRSSANGVWQSGFASRILRASTSAAIIPPSFDAVKTASAARSTTVLTSTDCVLRDTSFPMRRRGSVLWSLSVAGSCGGCAGDIGRLQRFGWHDCAKLHTRRLRPPRKRCLGADASRARPASRLPMPASLSVGGRRGFGAPPRRSRFDHLIQLHETRFSAELPDTSHIIDGR